MGKDNNTTREEFSQFRVQWGEREGSHDRGG
jgi:hypothetical protein